VSEIALAPFSAGSNPCSIGFLVSFTLAYLVSNWH